METVKMSSKGQVVIPKSLRESHHIRTGDRFVVWSVGDELRFRPAPAIAPADLQSVAGSLHRPGMKKRNDADIARRIGEQLLSQDAASKSK